MAANSRRKSAPKEEPAIERPSVADEKPKLGRIAVLALVGLGIGIAWPSLAGVHLGPNAPGSKPDATEPSASAEPATPATADPALAKVVPATTEPAVAPGANRQRVVVGKGAIRRCHEGKEKLEGEACGALRIDPLLAPALTQLAGCPSALGLSGALELGFDITFGKTTSDIGIVRGKKSELPSSTVNGVLACLADYIEDVSLERVDHKFTKYHVSYSLTFYPPGATLPDPSAPVSPEAAPDASREIGTVAWDTALVRSEPKGSDVVLRLVRGTRVTVLGRKKDWLHIRSGDKEGWVYRGALGM